jgi:hypothetical protein
MVIAASTVIIDGSLFGVSSCLLSATKQNAFHFTPFSESLGISGSHQIMPPGKGTISPMGSGADALEQHFNEYKVKSR